MIPTNSYKNIKFYLYYLSIFILISSILQIPFFSQINYLFIDQLHGAIEAREEIVIIAIDDDSLKQIGAWPWDRDVFAKLLTNLNHEAPEVIGLDILFLETREGDEELKQAISQSNSDIVLASKLIEGHIFESIFDDINTDNGFIHFYPDSDGKIRNTVIMEELDNECNISFAATIFSHFIRQNKKITCSDSEVLIGKNEYPQRLLFNYSDQDFKYYSFHNIYNGEFEPKDFKNKIILVGSTATDLKLNLQDNFISISGNRIPGVEIHAQIINSFLENKFQNNLPVIPFLIFMILINLILMTIWKGIKSNRLDFIILIATIFFFNILGIIIFNFGINWYFIRTNVLILSAYIFMIIFKYVTERQEKKFIKRAFNQYINPKLLESLLENPERLNLGGERKKITVLFSDIRSFTSISEKLNPEELIDLLNKYLDQMSKIIINNEGTIDKYIGDAIMAFWGAPVNDNFQEYNAVKSALEIEAELFEFNKKFPNFPKINIGIGINTGNIIVGNIGSKERFDYTVLGDNVNLGSRLEGLTKMYKVKTLVTASVVRNIKKQSIIFRLIDEVIVKGKTESVKIYQPLKHNKNNLKLKEIYEKGFKLYQKSEFEEAKSILSKIPKDYCGTLITNRIQQVSKISEWNGIWKWKHK
ncbi:CHASE2 domain-containing protein [Candidatus Dojkabacteria bacterium]|nr:CHASE2 domain-containing protein [Candidatus Dojkabacteria bacterium]